MRGAGGHAERRPRFRNGWYGFCHGLREALRHGGQPFQHPYGVREFVLAGRPDDRVRRGAKAPVWPFVHLNRTRVVPPCTVAEEETKEGLAALDGAPSVAAEYTV